MNLQSLQSGGLSQNVALRAGDTIFVPRAETVFVSGEVRTPGEYVIRISGMTVRQALALAGGVTERGSSRRVQIVRGGQWQGGHKRRQPADDGAGRRHNRRAGKVFLMADSALARVG